MDRRSKIQIAALWKIVKLAECPKVCTKFIRQNASIETYQSQSDVIFHTLSRGLAFFGRVPCRCRLLEQGERSKCTSVIKMFHDPNERSRKGGLRDCGKTVDARSRTVDHKSVDELDHFEDEVLKFHVPRCQTLREGAINVEAPGSLSRQLMKPAKRSNGHTLELALRVRKVDRPCRCTLLGRGHQLRQIQRDALVCCKSGGRRTSRLNRVFGDLPGEILRVGIGLEMHEGIALVAALPHDTRLFSQWFRGRYRYPTFCASIASRIRIKSGLT